MVSSRYVRFGQSAQLPLVLQKTIGCDEFQETPVTGSLVGEASAVRNRMTAWQDIMRLPSFSTRKGDDQKARSWRDFAAAALR
jgi:hypothetical protein